MNPIFWKDKRVLVTGHTGFKGSWLTLWLEHMGADVVGFSLDPPSEPNLFNDARIQDTVTSIHSDIRDLHQILSAFATHKPEIVFHLAAQALVRKSYRDPLLTYSTNVMGTANVLEAIRQTDSVRAAIIVTSDKCYENQEWVWPYRECDPLGGHDPYSSSKACAELVTESYRRSYFGSGETCSGLTLVATARAGNVIGGGDWGEDRLIPDIVRALREEKPALIRKPLAVRPWQHVLDPLHGYLVLAERLFEGRKEYCAAWNFGPDHVDSRTVQWMADRFVHLWGQDAKWIPLDTAGPHEAGALTLDSTNARTKLKWQPILDLDRALEWTCSWYKGYSEGCDPRDMTLDQIDRFQDITS